MASADELRKALDRPVRRGPATDDPAAVAPVEKPRREKKIRMTIDLEPVEFDEFREWRNGQARRLERGRVNASDVMIRLLRRLMVDEQLQREIMDVVERETK